MDLRTLARLWGICFPGTIRIRVGTSREGNEAAVRLKCRDVGKLQ